MFRSHVAPNARRRARCRCGIGIHVVAAVDQRRDRPRGREGVIAVPAKECRGTRPRHRETVVARPRRAAWQRSLTRLSQVKLSLPSPPVASTASKPRKKPVFVPPKPTFQSDPPGANVSRCIAPVCDPSTISVSVPRTTREIVGDPHVGAQRVVARPARDHHPLDVGVVDRVGAVADRARAIAAQRMRDVGRQRHRSSPSERRRWCWCLRRRRCPHRLSLCRRRCRA